jgi:ATP-binding cassette subfamily B protein
MSSDSQRADSATEPTPNDRRARVDDLPPALSSMWRLCRLGYTQEPRMVVLVVALTVLQGLPDVLFALWLKLLADALLARGRSCSS